MNAVNYADRDPPPNCYYRCCNCIWAVVKSFFEFIFPCCYAGPVIEERGVVPLPPAQPQAAAERVVQAVVANANVFPPARPSVQQQQNPSGELAFYPYEIGENALFDQVFPAEMVLKIFGYLDAKSLAKCGKVSRRWREIASTEPLWKAVSLKGVSPSLKVFDASDWFMHFGIKVKAPPVDGRKVLSALKRYRSQVEGDAGFTLLTIPKGLTFNKLVELANAPLQGHATPIAYVWDKISTTLGETPIPETVQVLITRNVLSGSRRLSVADQKALVARMGCEMPKLVEALALLIATFVSSGERLYNDNPWAFTHCEEQVAGYKVMVGGFSPAGLRVNLNLFGNDTHGVGGVLRKF